MLWEVDIFAAPGLPDVAAAEATADALDLGFSPNLTFGTARGYLAQGDLTREQIDALVEKLLADPVVERATVGRVGDPALDLSLRGDKGKIVYAIPKPGVTDAVADAALKSAREFGIVPEAVRTFKKYWIDGASDEELRRLGRKLLANDAIEQVAYGKLDFDTLQVGSSYKFELIVVPIRRFSDDELLALSKDMGLYLSLLEMRTIQEHFVKLDRDPTDVELETIAQTWSEHCSHKTLAGVIEYDDGTGTKRLFENMLKETIFDATVKIRENLGESDFCVSVFSDNAGVVKFDDEHNVCFKVETHNHPSALEPYGGANTGIGGVIRDPMGTGMGAKPVCNTDVFCFAPPKLDASEVPNGVLHPRRVVKGVVAGVRDYGNRMGIPTVNGAVYFDKRYLGNPLVYCGNVGLIPVDKSFKEPKPNDLIVAMGGRTGRDGIHGATFSSVELTSESETVSGGAVQIGNAITEKTVLDVMLEARDRGLYDAVTDCGAGGFSSAVGEMGEDIGAEVDLSAALLKYEGLSYSEIWISEAQERMVFAVPKDKWPELKALCDSEDVEAFVLGEFKPNGRLVLKYDGKVVADLEMKFMHKGRPRAVRQAIYRPTDVAPITVAPEGVELPARTIASEAVSRAQSCGKEFKSAAALDLEAILGSLNVASKHWIIRQYDHEVQGGSVLKPLVGVASDGPGDAAVLRPKVSSRRGLVVSNGMNPNYGDYDTYHMATSAIDEAIRNAVAVGANPNTISILDNFCWGASDKPEVLGSLVRAALACREASIEFGTPFISGKDSLNNEFRPEGSDEAVAIPPSLLISAMGQVDDVETCVSMDLKKPGDAIYLVGTTKNELGGSHLSLVRNWVGGQVPTVDVPLAKRIYNAIYAATQARLISAAHDLSEGGLAVALAESAFAGGFGAEVDLAAVELASESGSLGSLPGVDDVADCVKLFSESNSRFIVEVAEKNAEAFEKILTDAGAPFVAIGKVVEEPRLTIKGSAGGAAIDADLADLKRRWQKPLDLGGEVD
ncbi:MAG: phosphoribosylformylglycinamidine synthase subunit PurL [Thermoguttaceae bacterium]|nr:phosphoribosylformylglycinamidine synthase subunit PurL [Thermoguttaceae bacterium]